MFFRGAATITPESIRIEGFWCCGLEFESLLGSMTQDTSDVRGIFRFGLKKVIQASLELLVPLKSKITLY